MYTEYLSAYTVRATAALLVLAAISGCTAQNEISRARAEAVASTPESCLSQFAAGRQSHQHELDSTDIRVVNWNIQKGGDPDWTADLATVAGKSDLMILQEASFNMDAWEALAAGRYRSFAPGYRTPGASGSLTGVMTISSVEPLAHCSLISVEPWLRSPKATMITEYGLTGTDQSLLVVNIHVINFTFGEKGFREQIRRALSIMNGHSGPLLLSGDFNTWHIGRSEILRELTAELGLTMLNYDEDFRKRAFRQPLDHIYTRGLQVIDSTSSRVDSSDHNPMSARFSL
jgi:endonuclease/exonuclease/phosphatase (EEP) superfamily protein YafD